jgi:hypothetical protein
VRQRQQVLSGGPHTSSRLHVSPPPWILAPLAYHVCVAAPNGSFIADTATTFAVLGAIQLVGLQSLSTLRLEFFNNRWVLASLLRGIVVDLCVCRPSSLSNVVSWCQ